MFSNNKTPGSSFLKLSLLVCFSLGSLVASIHQCSNSHCEHGKGVNHDCCGGCAIEVSSPVGKIGIEADEAVSFECLLCHLIAQFHCDYIGVNSSVTGAATPVKHFSTTSNPVDEVHVLQSGRGPPRVFFV